MPALDLRSPELKYLMDRAEIEVKLNRDRAWLLETICALTSDDLARGATRSGHHPATRSRHAAA